MAKKNEERFGDPRLSNREIAPLRTKYRVMGVASFAPLWGAVGMTPGVYALATGALPLLPAMLALGAGMVASATLGYALTGSANRYGVGFVAQCRAALGARGGAILLVLRWWVGVIGVSALALETGAWSRKLLVIGLENIGVVLPPLGWHLPGAGGPSAFGWLVGALFCAGAWWVARKGIANIGRLVVYGGAAALGFGAALLVFGGIASKGFGEYIKRDAPWTAGDLGLAAAGVLAMTAIAVWSAADWARFRKPDDGGSTRRGPSALLTPLAMVPPAIALAFIGAAVASAARAVSGTSYGVPIPDATALGSVWAGLGGVLFALALWLAAVPLVGLYSTALCLCGLFPRKLHYKRAVLITFVAQVLVVPAVSYAAAAHVSLGSIGLLVGAPLGVLLVDEVLLRRGKLMLEEAYLYSREYGPVFGFMVSGLLALAAGWVLHPEIYSRLPEELLASLPAAARAWATTPHAGTVAFFGGMIVAGVSFGLLGPLERLLLGRAAGKVGGAVKRAMDRRSEKGPPRIIGESKRAGEQNTNPHFEYDGGDKRSEKEVQAAVGALLAEDTEGSEVDEADGDWD